MSQSDPRIAVIGATGFVGRAVCAALESRGVAVRRVRAPRLVAPSRPFDTTEIPSRFTTEHAQLIGQLAGTDVVVNCAGNPDAGSRDTLGLYGANGLLPGLVGAAARAAGARRYVHVSSAVVQGRAATLDESFRVDGFSAYARSKILGERTALDLGPRESLVYRPPSVHDASRKVSRMTSRIARSPLASVAAPGSQNSPQALVANVGDIVAFLALVDEQPPTVVIHPSEGLTSVGLMRVLGERDPVRIPRPLARAAVTVAERLGRVVPAVAANARRIEMLWFGQDQAPSWATRHGWTPPAGHDAWVALGRSLSSPTTEGHDVEPR